MRLSSRGELMVFAWGKIPTRETKKESLSEYGHGIER